MQTSLFGFLGTGTLAATVHYVVALLIHAWGINPEQANWTGFFCAVPVSYFGHRAWSFRGSQSSHTKAFVRFFLVALLGFLGNQILLMLGLQFTPLPFWLLLAIVMIVIAASTYLLSRFWAFHHT